MQCHRGQVCRGAIPHPNYPRPVAGGCSRLSGEMELPSCLWSTRQQACSIRKLEHSGSIFFNYKHFFSIVMLMMRKFNYKAIWAHVGSPGLEFDCGIYKESPLFRGAQAGTINLPPPEPLPNDTEDTPYFFIGDDAFPLRQYMLKPYSDRYLDQDQLVFNYRLSLARRVVENQFDIMAKRFRCLLTTLEVQPEKSNLNQ